jgi:hypothetical protein
LLANDRNGKAMRQGYSAPSSGETQLRFSQLFQILIVHHRSSRIVACSLSEKPTIQFFELKSGPLKRLANLTLSAFTPYFLKSCELSECMANTWTPSPYLKTG